MKAVDAAALALVLIGLPLWLRLVPPNRFYGYRTRRSLRERDYWHALNGRFGRNLVIGSLAFLALSWLLRAREIELAVSLRALVLVLVVLAATLLARRAAASGR